MHLGRSCVAPLSRWLLLLSALWCVSCSGSGGGSLNPVEGKVLYKGQPAAGAVVTFHPTSGGDVTAVRPTGVVKQDGTYTLESGQQKGAPAGEYAVTIIWPEEVQTKQQKPKGLSMEAPESRDKLNGAYANRASSPFKVQIKSGKNQLEPIELK